MTSSSDKKSQQTQDPSKVSQVLSQWAGISPCTPCADYSSRYVVVNYNADSITVLDSYGSKDKRHKLSAKEVGAVATLPSSESLITLSRDGTVKIWDIPVHKEEKDELKPIVEFKIEDQDLFEHAQFKEGKAIHEASFIVLPDEKHAVFAKLSYFHNPESIILIDLDKKTSEKIQPSMNFDFIAFSEPNFLVLINNNNIYLFDINQKDFLKKPPTFEYALPNVRRIRNFSAWPGGHLWAICEDSLRTISTDKKEEKKGQVGRSFTEEMQHHLSVYFFTPDGKLTHLVTSAEKISPHYKPIMSGENIYYATLSMDSFIKTLNVRTGIESYLLRPEFHHGYESNIRMIDMFNTRQGVCIAEAGLAHSYKLRLFPLTKGPELTREQIIDILNNQAKVLSRDTAGIVADYVGFFAQSTLITRQPQAQKLPEIIAKLNNWIQKFQKSPEEKSKNLAKTLTQLMDDLVKTEERERKESTTYFADCIAKYPTLTTLLDKNSSSLKRLALSKDEKQQLALLLQQIIALDQSKLVIVPKR